MNIALSDNQKTILVVGSLAVLTIAIVSVAKGFNQAESSVGSGVGTGAAVAGGGIGLAALLFVFLL